MLDVGAGGAVCTNQKSAFSGWHHAGSGKSTALMLGPVDWG